MSKQEPITALKTQQILDRLERIEKSVAPQPQAKQATMANSEGMRREVFDEARRQLDHAQEGINRARSALLMIEQGWPDTTTP